jgi:tetratricopeptide (TPR) repeat protein
MRKITTLFLIFFSLTVFGQTDTEIIKKANDFIAVKKYETAYKLLDKFDPTNDKPEIVLLKEDILLNYFVTSIMHQMFALTDIKTNEDILDYRGKEGAYGMQMFQVDSILTRLIKIHPNNCKLYKGLSEYYYDVYLRYGGRWLKDDNELFQLLQTNLLKVVDGNCADYLSYYILGYINLSQEKNNESIPYFVKSIELNNKYASSHYNLAYAYLFNDDLENALKYAKTAYDLYIDKEYKSDAARMVGQIYTELKDDKNALIYYEKANKIDPENYYNLNAVLNLYVKTSNKKSTKTTKAFFNLAPENPTIYNDLDEIYSSNEKVSYLIEFYNSQFSGFKDNNKVIGNLNFYLARIYLDTDKKLAKDYFKKAKRVFEEVYEKDHPVFEAINEGLEQCKE